MAPRFIQSSNGNNARRSSLASDAIVPRFCTVLVHCRNAMPCEGPAAAARERERLESFEIGSQVIRDAVLARELHGLAQLGSPARIGAVHLHMTRHEVPGAVVTSTAAIADRLREINERSGGRLNFAVNGGAWQFANCRIDCYCTRLFRRDGIPDDLIMREPTNLLAASALIAMSRFGRWQMSSRLLSAAAATFTEYMERVDRALATAGRHEPISDEVADQLHATRVRLQLGLDVVAERQIGR